MSSNDPDVSQQPLALSDIIHPLSPSPVPESRVSRQAASSQIHSTSTEEHPVQLISEDSRSSSSAEAQTSPLQAEAGSGSVPQTNVSGVSSGDISFLGRRLDNLDLDLDILTQEDVEGMQRRLDGLGVGASGVQPSTATSSRESELAIMVLRLLSHYHYTSELDLSSQLASQAETIASLTTQRDILIHQHAEACANWQVERDGWERSAEALIAQKTAVSAMTRDEVVTSLMSRLEDENKRLRNKVAEYQNTHASVESELFKLRPLLLIPPVAGEPSKRHKATTKRPPAQALATSGRHKQEAEHTSQFLELKVVSENIPIQPRIEALNGQEDQAAGITDDTSLHASETQEGSVPSSSQATLSSVASHSNHVASSFSERHPQAASQESLYQTPQAQGQQSGHSYYRTARERELDLAIPTPRKARSTAPSAVPSTSSGHYSRGQARGANQHINVSGVKQVMNPLWLATSTSRTRAEKRAASMLSDAKAELMLSAARRIGKRRVGLAAGFVAAGSNREARDLVDHKGKGKERADRAEKSKVEKGKARDVDRRDEQDGAATPHIQAKKQTKKKTLKKANTLPNGSSTPSANAAGTGYYTPLQGMSHLVYLNPVHAGQGVGPIPMQMPGGSSAVPVLVPMSGWPPMMPSAGSSSSIPKASKEGERITTAPDTTPTRLGAQATPTLPRSDSHVQSQGLDSLLSAARMLEDDEISESSGVATPTRASEPDRRGVRAVRRNNAAVRNVVSPTPATKRRKVAPGTPASALSLEDTTPVHSPAQKGRGSVALGRVSSALDVLADQAAQEQIRRPSAGPSVGPPAGPSARRRSLEMKPQTHRVASRKRLSRGRGRPSDSSGHKVTPKGRTKTTAPEEPERHSSLEASLSRKRRRSSTGVGSSQSHSPRGASSPSTAPDPPPPPEDTLLHHTDRIDLSADTQPEPGLGPQGLPSRVSPEDNAADAPSSEDPIESQQSTQPTLMESSAPREPTASSNTDGLGSQESVMDVGE